MIFGVGTHQKKCSCLDVLTLDAYIIQKKFKKIQRKIFLNSKPLNPFKTYLVALVCIPEVLMHLLTPILPSDGKCVIYVKNAKNGIFDTHAIRHISFIDMAIWGSKQALWPKECTPMSLDIF